MQVYVIGIGQCGASVAYDVIAGLTGLVKSKDVKFVPQARGAKAASNDLLERMNKGLDLWKAHVTPWLDRSFGSSADRRAFILPRIAIIDGNPDNFVKDAFSRLAGGLTVDDSEREDWNLRQLVQLISGTKVLGLGMWASGCANGLVGEAVTTANLQPAALRGELGIDGHGNFTDANAPFPVAVFLVVSSGGGATGSGGGVYLAQTDALLARAGQGSQADGPSHAIVANAVVLPSVEASSDNKRHALNAGRALARHGNTITRTRDGDGPREEPSSVILFSNAQDEGDSRALQQLNNYLAEFAIRLASFTYPGNVAGVARDVDTRELMFLRGKTSVLAMSHLAEELWDERDEGALESTLVQRAFADLYESSVDKPHGLSVESVNGERDPASVLQTASAAMVVVGAPPSFKGPLKLAKITACLREHSGSKLESGIRYFAYGSAKHLELTVFLRYRYMSACPLATHFVRQYVGEAWHVDADELPEMEHIRSRASHAEEDDEYAETFEALATDLEQIDHSMNFDTHVVHRPSELQSQSMEEFLRRELGRLARRRPSCNALLQRVQRRKDVARARVEPLSILRARDEDRV